MSDQGYEAQYEEILRFLQSFLPPRAAEQAARQLIDSGMDLSRMLPLHNPSVMAQLGAQIKAMFASSSGPVNWTLALQAAKQAVAGDGVEQLSAADAAKVKQALVIADLWLDPVTDFTVPGVGREAWKRTDWLQKTLESWKEICNPAAARITQVFTEAVLSQMGTELDVPAEDLQEALEEALGSAPSGVVPLPPAAIQQMLPQLTATMFAYQIGHALGALAQESLGAGDFGLPLVKEPVTALLPKNIDSFGQNLEIPPEEVLQFVAVRECASARLFASVPWLSTDLELAIRNYAEQIDVDVEAIEQAARRIDFSQMNPLNPSGVTDLLGPELFAANPTEGQQRALERLEILLALVEGWVEVVTAQATSPYLPNADRLREMMRRRRVAGTASEQLLGQLLGLKMRARHARGAAQIFQLVQDEGAAASQPLTRDGLWSHPDMVPTISEMESPETFLVLRDAQALEATQFDEALEQLLEGTLGWTEGVSPAADAGEGSSPHAKPVEKSSENPTENESPDGDAETGSNN